MLVHSLVKMADWTMWYKYIVKNVARRHGKVATFMPKPIFGDNGSGMKCHQPTWTEDNILCAGDKSAGLPGNAINYMRGLLKNAPSFLAIASPGRNRYRRLVTGFE